MWGVCGGTSVCEKNTPPEKKTVLDKKHGPGTKHQKSLGQVSLNNTKPGVGEQFLPQDSTAKAHKKKHVFSQAPVGPADCNRYNCKHALFSESSELQHVPARALRQRAVTVAVVNVCWSYALITLFTSPCLFHCIHSSFDFARHVFLSDFRPLRTTWAGAAPKEIVFLRS